MSENQTINETQVVNDRPQKKGILEQLKGMNFFGYLCIAAIADAVASVAKAIIYYFANKK